jgi:hypothetical protein
MIKAFICVERKSGAAGRYAILAQPIERFGDIGNTKSAMLSSSG